jgi:hypothetical protein
MPANVFVGAGLGIPFRDADLHGIAAVSRQFYKAAKNYPGMKTCFN